jgi:hypothetical protein
MKISLVDKQFPLKMKVIGLGGKYSLFISFFDPFPNKEKCQVEFLDKKDLLVKFRKPRHTSPFMYLGYASEGRARIQIKIWFTGIFMLFLNKRPEFGKVQKYL